MKYVLFFIILIHAFIHSLGFRQAFDLIRVHQFTQPVSRAKGLVWLLASILFLTTAFFTLFQNENWWMLGIPSILISQYLIFSAWHDAKHGTWVNVLLLMVAITNYMEV